jgi:hypothetical protein
MNLYLDDDTAERRLVTLFTQAGHGVVRPIDVQLVGASDAQHFLFYVAGCCQAPWSIFSPSPFFGRCVS